ncbi:MAG: hypothetical protein J7M05_03500 [Anaerolineae bacterium]|nr:hypothetical protein [Anaerolineae bacterium]
MGKVDAKSQQTWQENPERTFDLIVRVVGDVEKRAAELERHGMKVRRRLRLSGSLGIRCKGKKALELLKLPWVKRIEPDRPVRALRR